MGGKKWTEKELEYLKNWYDKKPFEELAQTLGRTVSAVRSKGQVLGLSAGVLWTKEEEQFLKENYLLLGAEECARQLERTVASVHGKIRKIGGGRPSIGPRIAWSDEELDFLRKNYQRLSWEELSTQLGRTEQAIQVRASMLGMQRYTDPYEFFETWTEESAYTIGFFAADGWVNKRGPESIRIGFAQKDADVLLSISRAIGVGQVYVKQNGMHQYYVQSIRTYERLCEVFGQDVCNKTHTLQWPDVPKECARHFVRGAVDGDGSFFRNRQDNLPRFAYTTSSQPFIDGFVNAVEQMTGIQMAPKLNKISVWHARCAGIKAVCVADWLYRDANIALARKADFARKLMEGTGIAYGWTLTRKMRETFPHILERYEIVERAAQ